MVSLCTQMNGSSSSVQSQADCGIITPDVFGIVSCELLMMRYITHVIRFVGNIISSSNHHSISKRLRNLYPVWLNWCPHICMLYCCAFFVPISQIWPAARWNSIDRATDSPAMTSSTSSGIPTEVATRIRWERLEWLFLEKPRWLAHLWCDIETIIYSTKGPL